jgi:hypothetical protein
MTTTLAEIATTPYEELAACGGPRTASLPLTWCVVLCEGVIELGIWLCESLGLAHCQYP